MVVLTHELQCAENGQILSGGCTFGAAKDGTFRHTGKANIEPPTSSGHLVEIVRREMIRGHVENASVECLRGGGFHCSQTVLSSFLSRTRVSTLGWETDIIREVPCPASCSLCTYFVPTLLYTLTPRGIRDKSRAHFAIRIPSSLFEPNMAEHASISPVATEQGHNAPTQGTHLVADVSVINLVNWVVY